MYPQIVIGEYSISSYLLFAIIGFCFSFFILSNFLLKKMIFRKYIYVCFISCVGMIFFSKLFGFISYLVTIYKSTGRISWKYSFIHSGIVYLGGLIGYLLILYILCKFKNRSWDEIKDPISIVIPLFHGFGRVGCYFAGCCYGKNSNSWFAFPYRTVATGYIWENRFPVQLSEAVFEFMIFFFLFHLYKKYTFKSNNLSILRLYLFFYSIWRFFIEFLRGDEQRGVFGNFSFSQIICFCIIIWLISKLLSCFRRKV